MPLASGSSIGPAEIEAPLGEGGMGAVNRNSDTTALHLLFRHAPVSSSFTALTSQAPDGNASENSDPWDLKAARLRRDVAKFREELERLLEAEELRTFIYRTRYNRVSRHLRPYQQPRREDKGASGPSGGQGGDSAGE